MIKFTINVEAFPYRVLGLSPFSLRLTHQPHSLGPRTRPTQSTQNNCLQETIVFSSIALTLV
ncbi:MAG: hypothetical protein SFZ03_00665 [Candidatus Melainabacteria bacterium]|nr:hypothetical protein [Candidatus Melainabacteria bacterium]